MIDTAKSAALSNDLETTGKILGSRAKVQKDKVYGILMEAVGGIDKIAKAIKDRDKEILALRDYVMQRYKSGEDECIKILEEVAAWNPPFPHHGFPQSSRESRENMFTMLPCTWGISF